MDAFLALDELHATAQHIQLVNAKLEKLARARDDSWAQILTTAARMYRTGRLDNTDLIGLYESMRDGYGAGHSKVWNAHMPIPANRVLWSRMDPPNGPMGSWFGEDPIGLGNPAPPYGVSVVYVLFDAANEPIYVGSTSAFRSRLAAHRKDKPGVRRWAAYPCRDRDHAYEIEDRLLRQHMPPMNKKASR